MLSRLTTEEEVVLWAVELPGEEWRRLTTEISWLHRRGAGPDEVPPALKHVALLVCDKEEWDKLRKRVRNLKQKVYREGRKAQLEAAAARRRTYMRTYMRQRRTTNAHH